jgi:type IV pilus assembly protein PilV
MLGIASMFMVAHKASSSSYLRQLAVQSAYNIIDKMRANRQQAINGAYNVSNLVNSGTPTPPSSPGVLCTSSTCTASQLASYDVWYWLSADVAQLPSGAGSISTTVNGINTLVTVIVQWSDLPAQNLLGAGGQVTSSNPAIAQFSIGTSL